MSYGLKFDQSPRYEVRVDGDGEREWMVMPWYSGDEDFYDEYDLKSALEYATEVEGWVVEILEKLIPPNSVRFINDEK